MGLNQRAYPFPGLDALRRDKGRHVVPWTLALSLQYSFSKPHYWNTSKTISPPKVMATPSSSGPFSLAECPARSSAQKLLTLFLFLYNKAQWSLGQDRKGWLSEAEPQTFKDSMACLLSWRGAMFPQEHPTL